MSFLVQSILVGSYALAVVRKSSFGSKWGGTKYAKEITKDGFVNTPAKLSRTLIFSLSVVLLGTFGISSSEIGIFYVTLMISLVVGGMALSIAYMAIPASAASKTDLSLGSIRLSLSLTVPIIAALIVAPKYILSLIGAQYTSAETILLILSLGILPYSIVMNTITKFNNLGNSRKLISIGVIQILAFVVSFFLLVPHYGTLGAAFSILIAFVASSIPSIIWSERTLVRYVSSSCVALITGVTAGYISALIFGRIHPLGIIMISIFASLAVIFALKNTSASEIRQLVKSIVKKEDGYNVRM
jgi:O-antigen/teichoic acid export membrane protein